MQVARKKGKFLLLFMSYVLVAALVGAASAFYSSFNRLECEASTYLQERMRFELSKGELESARSNSNFCPRTFFFKRDNGSNGCAFGYVNILRGPEVTIGGCG
ncbi:hypothetical protein [Microbulbifer harenosus]|uniref:Uncharacterized protein n=1 Tax=Microbulbifer harenosus TaxID=2576840 RepID=A0ABY2UCU9_9GAMM|nr:hypothetical protein [Microbulbifer harenosus]TLM73379.1 hypothetical protein FDY93_19065 [Microbulbifer harenosus]